MLCIARLEYASTYLQRMEICLTMVALELFAACICLIVAICLLPVIFRHALIPKAPAPVQISV